MEPDCLMWKIFGGGEAVTITQGRKRAALGALALYLQETIPLPIQGEFTEAAMVILAPMGTQLLSHPLLLQWVTAIRLSMRGGSTQERVLRYRYQVLIIILKYRMAP